MFFAESAAGGNSCSNVGRVKIITSVYSSTTTIVFRLPRFAPVKVVKKFTFMVCGGVCRVHISLQRFFRRLFADHRNRRCLLQVLCIRYIDSAAETVIQTAVIVCGGETCFHDFFFRKLRFSRCSASLLHPPFASSVLASIRHRNILFHRHPYVCPLKFFAGWLREVQPIVADSSVPLPRSLSLFWRGDTPVWSSTLPVSVLQRNICFLGKVSLPLPRTGFVTFPHKIDHITAFAASETIPETFIWGDGE